MDLNNTVIEVLNLEHGKKVIQFYRDNGYNTVEFVGSCTKEDNAHERWYGVINSRFRNYSLSGVKSYQYVKIIELPENTFKNGDVVEGSKNGSDWQGQMIYVGKNIITGGYIALSNPGIPYNYDYIRKPQPKPNFQKEIDELIEKAKKEGVELTVKIN